jgi:hypothetical protein
VKLLRARETISAIDYVTSCPTADAKVPLAQQIV